MLLCAGMVVVPLASLVHVGDRVPGVRVETSARADRLAMTRATPAAASRSSVRLLSAEDRATTTSTAAPTTTAAPETTTTAAPTTTTTRVVRAAAQAAVTSSTTAKPTTTTAKPTTTTAKPTTTTTAAPTTTTTAAPRTQEGGASYFEAATPDECAHRTLPFGTVVTVTNLDNGKKTTCTVGDRGPYVDGRILDLSKEKFSELAPLSAGVIRVRIEW